MLSEDFPRLRASFIKAFSSVPDSLRTEIIVVVEGDPYTWESAFVEIKNSSEKAQKILIELKKLDIIN